MPGGDPKQLAARYEVAKTLYRRGVTRAARLCTVLDSMELLPAGARNKEHRRKNQMQATYRLIEQIEAELGDQMVPAKEAAAALEEFQDFCQATADRAFEERRYGEALRAKELWARSKGANLDPPIYHDDPAADPFPWGEVPDDHLRGFIDTVHKLAKPIDLTRQDPVN